MNKRNLRRVAIVALVLVLLCNTLGVQASTKKDDPTVIVKDYGSLYTAIAEAKDNDVIGIQGTITIPAIVDLNMSENKAVILRRMEAGAKLVVSGDYGADNKASFRMISFDGNSTEVGGTEPFVEINGNAYFSMCDFTECFNQSDNGGAINISSGEVELSSCSFDGNSASYGSHIFNSGTLLVNSCTLKGGWADEMGGAIYNRGTLTVKGTEIKENNARIGGGIYNNSSLEVDNSLIWSNTATVQGTDIANEGTYTNSTTEEQFDSWLDYYKLYYAGWEDDTNTSVGGSGDCLKFLTATEKPTKPDPTEPVDPEPTEPSTPDPVTPPSGGDEGKTDPEPTDPTPTEPTDPEPTDPKPTEPDNGTRITTVAIRNIYKKITDNLEVNKGVVKQDIVKWLNELKATLSDTSVNEKIQKDLDKLERKRTKLLEAYLEDFISKDDYKAKYEAIEGQIEEKKKLLVPVEENEDIKVIESVLQNIDDEIDAYVKTLDMEESKVDFLIEHTKRITVLENRDIIIELDLVAGAIIAGKDFLLYVHDTMPQHHGSKHLHPSGPQTAPRCCFRDRFSCDQS